MRGRPGYLRLRVIKRFDAGNSEITDDMDHLGSTWTVRAMRPGDPSSSMTGQFTVMLPPPGSKRWKSGWSSVFSQLVPGVRIEAYLGYTRANIGLGQLAYAGFITEISFVKGTAPSATLTGEGDLWLAAQSKPFPGEWLSLDYGSGATTLASYRQARHYFGMNEVGYTDSFSAYAGTGTSAAFPTKTAGTWSASTDNGVNVVTCSTGSAAVLLFSGLTDAGFYHKHYVEVQGRLKPSSDATNAGSCGVGLSGSGADVTNSLTAFIRAKFNSSTGHYDVDVVAESFAASVATTTTFSSQLTNVDEDGYIAFNIGYMSSADGSAITVNGQQVIARPTTMTAGFNAASMTPYLMFGTPTTGTANAYFSNLVHMHHYCDDVNVGTAAFASGTIGTPLHSLPQFSQAGTTFLDVWTQAATRENFLLRYTPQAVVIPGRVIGAVDFTNDPGVDRTKDLVFSFAKGNLVTLEVEPNADAFATSTSALSTPGTDGGGIAFSRDVASIQSVGVIEDQTLHVPVRTFVSAQAAAARVLANKIKTGQSTAKTATVLRDSETADKFRELDQITIDEPELGFVMTPCRILARTFTEGSPYEVLILDQFPASDLPLVSKRVGQGVTSMAGSFSRRS